MTLNQIDGEHFSAIAASSNTIIEIPAAIGIRSRMAATAFI